MSTYLPSDLGTYTKRNEKRINSLERRGRPIVSTLFPNPYVVADLDFLGSATVQAEGAWRHVDALNIDFQVQDGVWVQKGVAVVATTTARDTEYAKASAAYQIAGVEVFVTADSTTYRRVGSNWAKWNKPTAAWTPTFTGPTLGTSTVSGWYGIRQGQVSGTGKLTIGSGFSVGTNPRVAWPENIHSAVTGAAPVGQVLYRDTSATDQWYGPLMVYPTDLTSMVLLRFAQPGSYAATDMGRAAAWQTGNPIATLAAGDLIQWNFNYLIENAY